MPMPIAAHPKPARNPAVAPHMGVVPGALRKKARLIAITRLMRNAAMKMPALAGAGASLNPLALCHARPKRTGEYHKPPTRKAETAAARIAQRLRAEAGVIQRLGK